MSGQRHFHEELDALKARLVAMGGLAEQAVTKAVESLQDRNLPLAEKVLESDRDINDLELQIDDMAMQLLALQQPMARDLRFIIMAMRISNDLERVGDHAVNIAQAATFLIKEPPFVNLPELDDMVVLVGDMLNDALDSYVRADSKLAREIVTRDDRVDELHENVFRILLTHMMSDPRRIHAGMDLLLVSRNLERIADLATNIAEDVVYMVEGRIIKHHAEDMETESRD
ncbi:MAG: phosphate signaling complex protein PhoU [Longimicrobiales bacterium]